VKEAPMKKSDSSLAKNTQPSFIVAGLLALAAVHAASATAATDTYTWSAELVSVDENARTVTIQAPLVGNAEIDLGRLERGDRVTLTWSGISMAAGIRRVTDGAAPEADWLTLPIEFVSAEHDGRYVRFSVPVPSGDLAKLASLSPGQWVTATSPRRANSHEEAVAEMRPYNDVG
jgi:hypothetical protein